MKAAVVVSLDAHRRRRRAGGDRDRRRRRVTPPPGAGEQLAKVIPLPDPKRAS